MSSIKHTDPERNRTIHVPEGMTLAEPLLYTSAGDHTCSVTLTGNARLELTVFVFAGEADSAESGTVRLSLTVDVTGPGAEFHLHGLYIANGRRHVDINVKVNHLVPGCTSRQLIKGIAAGEATGEFTGLIHVAREAQHTDAALHNRNLQLSDTARIFTRPQLEIYADDVKCGHGASVGQLDQEAIYYMRQRGVSEHEARRMQMQGFVNDIINRCPSEPLRESIAARADELIANF